MTPKIVLYSGFAMWGSVLLFMFAASKPEVAVLRPISLGLIGVVSALAIVTWILRSLYNFLKREEDRYRRLIG